MNEKDSDNGFYGIMVKKNSRSGVAPKERLYEQGRKTTQEERAEIVAFCIEHGKD